MSLHICVIFLLAGHTARGQDDNSKFAKIEGQVQDSVTCQPVRKAVVILREDRSRQMGGAVVLTDAAGHFEFSNLAPGTWSAGIQRDGYVTLGSFEDTSATQLRWKLEPGMALKDLTFSLMPAGVIAGRVLDSDGEPLAGVSVQLADAAPKKNARPLPWAQTNDLGEYRLYNVAPGKYAVSASYEPDWHRTGAHLVLAPAASGKTQPREDYMTTYYPGVADLSQAGQVVVTAGAQISGIDVHMTRGGVVRVRGRVTGASSGFPAIVMMMQLDTHSQSVGKSYDAITKPDGSFEFDNVLPGRYLLQGNAGFDTDALRGSQRIDVGHEDVEGVQLAVSRPQKIEGRIRMEDAGRLPEGLHAMLVPRGDNPTHQGGGLGAVRADGSFTLDAVFEGTYDLMLAKFQGEPDDSYVKSIRYGDEDALTGGLEVRGAGIGKLEVTLRDDGGTIACRVATEKDEPAVHAKVEALPAEPHRAALVLHGQCETDDQGQCQMRGMAPGTYFLLAVEGQELPDVRDDDTWHRTEKFATQVEVTARVAAHADVKLSPPHADGE